MNAGGQGDNVSDDEAELTSVVRDEPGAPQVAFLPKAWIYVMCSGDFGLAFVWVVKYAVTSSFVRQALGGGPLVSHIVWSLGPLSGLIVAPIVGALSDRCASRIGRRRPYIAGGMLACLLGMAIFASARRLAGGKPGAAAITIAVIGFAILDFASNVVMFPSRALLGDLVPPEQQHDVQSAAAVIASVAEIIAGAYIFSWDEPVTHIERIFFVAGVMMALSVSISLIVCKETPIADTYSPDEWTSRGVQHTVQVEEQSHRVRFAGDASRRSSVDVEMQPLSFEMHEAEERSNENKIDSLSTAKKRHEPSAELCGDESPIVPEDSDEDTVEIFRRILPSSSSELPSRREVLCHHDARRNEDPSISPKSGAKKINLSNEAQMQNRSQAGNDDHSHSDTPSGMKHESLSVALSSENAEQDSLFYDELKAHKSDASDSRSLGEDSSQLCSGRGQPYDDNILSGGSLTFDRAKPKSLVREITESVRSSVRNFPKPLSYVGLVYFLAWACWFACLPTYALWIGEAVLRGDPDAEAGTAEAQLYERGVTIFSLANVIKAFIALCFSAFYPAMVRFVGDVGERVVFGIPFAVFSFVIWKLAYTNSAIVATFVVSAGAIPFITTQTIPVAIAVARFPENLASNLGILNLFCVAAQLFDTLYTGTVAKYFGEQAVMRIAGAWAAMAGLAAFLLL